MKRFALLLGLGLTAAGCSGGGSLPLPSPPPPGPVVHPGTELALPPFSPLDASAICSGSPFGCSGGSAWGLLQASDLAKFTPGPILGFNTGPNAGMALVAVATLARSAPLSLEETVRLDSLACPSTVSYQGPVAYGGGVDDGDPSGRYRAEYISCFPGDQTVRVWLYSPTYAAPLPGSPVVSLGLHTLRLDWYPGDHVDYWLDGQLLFTENEAFAHDPLDAPHDLHPALWFGGASGAVISFRAWGASPP